MITIWRASLYAFWRQEPVTVKGNLTIMRNMGMMTKEELGLEGLFPPLGTYMLKGEVLMGVAYVTLRLYLRKGIYAGHLQCHEYIPYGMVQYICIWSVGNGGHHFRKEQ